MTIVIDGRSIGDELSGIGRYTIGLLRGMVEIGADSRVLVLAGRPELIDAHVGRHAFADVITSRHAPLSIRGQLAAARTIRRSRADLYHAPYLYAPIAGVRARIVVTVHDLIPHRFPQGVPKSRKTRWRRVWNRWTRLQCRRADAIVTVSDFSRRELIEHFQLPAEKVVRVYNGVDAPDGDVSGGDGFRARFGVPGRIIAYLGRHDPYKNLTTLIRAFRLAAKRTNDRLILVIGGKLDPRYPEAGEVAREQGVADHVVFTGYLDEADRMALLRATEVFVFPSRYEGFGLPPLEAMAAGVPVVASNATSLPEVLGEAATLVDPDDANAMADGIAALLNDQTLRETRIEAGRQQASKFTWRQCAREHLALYDILIAR